MSDHLNPEQLEDYRKRTLPPEELRVADSHLASCETCRTALRSSVDASAALASVRSALQDAAHLQFEEMEAYLTGEAPAEIRAMVEAHVGICERCARELRDLRAFEKMPARAPLDEELIAAERAASTGLRANFLRAPIYRWAGAIVMILVAALVVRYASLNSNSDQSAKLKSAQESVPPASSAPPQLKDGPRTISITPQGVVTGLDDFPPEYSSRIVNALVAVHFERSNAVESSWAARELPSARKRFPDSHLLLGVLEYHAGHLPQARVEFNALAQENPNVPEAQHLLAKLDELNH